MGPYHHSSQLAINGKLNHEEMPLRNTSVHFSVLPLTQDSLRVDLALTPSRYLYVNSRSIEVYVCFLSFVNATCVKSCNAFNSITRSYGTCASVVADE